MDALGVRLRSFFFSTRPRWEALLRAVEAAKVELFLVGGVVRDLVRCDGPVSSDVDFAISPSGIPMAEAWAKSLGGRPVLFDENTPTLRVYFPDGRVVDFTAFRGATLEDDLRLRDFTVNAVAIPMRDLMGEGPLTFLDPLGGIADIKRGVLRWASERSLSDDPLRMLRTFRFMATHGYTIDPSLFESICREHLRISQVSAERIRDEFFKILASPRAASTLREMDKTRLLTTILPELEPMRGVSQNEYHHLDVWEHTLEALRCFDEEPIPQPLSPYASAIAESFETIISQGIPAKALIRFALLLHDVAKPQTRSLEPDGRVRFFGHDVLGAEIAHEVSKRLMLANRACEIVHTLVREHLVTMNMEISSVKAIRRFCRRVGVLTPYVWGLIWSDMRASLGPARTEQQQRRTASVLYEMGRFYYEEFLPAQNRPRLLTGHDVIDLGVPQGPLVGALLARVLEAQAEGILQSREEALEFVRRELERGSIS